jgi:hypothetical protein
MKIIPRTTLNGTAALALDQPNASSLCSALAKTLHA